MKRTISLLLAVIMVLTGCSQPQTQNPSTEPTTDSVADIVSVPTEWIEEDICAPAGASNIFS